MRRKQLYIFPLILLFLALLLGINGPSVEASVLTAPDGGYYNVPTGTKFSEESIYDAQINIPKEAQEGASFVTKNFSAFIVDFANAVLNFFGLHSIDQLARSTTHLFWGALDLNDVKIISMITIPLTAVAWTVAAVSYKVFSVKLAVTTMNSRKRVKIYEFFETWLMGALLLTFGMQLINLIFQVASIFTDTFLSGIPGGTFNPIKLGNFADGVVAKAGSGIAYALLGFAMVGLTFGLNLMYLQRYVMLLVYAALAPVFFAMYFFDTTRNLFWNWIKNLVSLAFIPVAHSLLMLLYTYASYSMGDHHLLRLVFLLLFMVITESILNLGGLSAGTGGLSNHVLTGLGLGIALSGIRGLGGVFSALNASGNVEGALATMGAGREETGLKRPGSEVGASQGTGGAGSAAGNIAGALSGANQRLARTKAFVEHAKNVGSKFGAVAGGVSGAVMGASTGNMGMMALGGITGSSGGSKVGATASRKIAGVGAVQGQIIGEQLKSHIPSSIEGSEVSKKPLTRSEIKENLFGAGPNLPNEFESLRPQITEANIAGLQGTMPSFSMGSVTTSGGTKIPVPKVGLASANRMNSELASAISSQISSVTDIAPQEGDRAFSRAYADHTEYYYQPAGQQPILVDYTMEGDRMASMDRAIETVQEYRGKKDDQGNMVYQWHDVQRVSVSPSQELGSPGMPWTWNTRKSIVSEARV